MVTYDGAGASHDLIACLDKLARRTGHQLVYSVGWEVNQAWDRSQVTGGTTSLGQFEISLKNIGTGIATAANKLGSGSQISLWVNQFGHAGRAAHGGPVPAVHVPFPGCSGRQPSQVREVRPGSSLRRARDRGHRRESP